MPLFSLILDTAHVQCSLSEITKYSMDKLCIVGAYDAILHAYRNILLIIPPPKSGCYTNQLWT